MDRAERCWKSQKERCHILGGWMDNVKVGLREIGWVVIDLIALKYW
jgi:hypothetical protein